MSYFISVILNVVMLSVIMASVIFFYCYAECRYSKCHYAECHYGECHILFIVTLSVINLIGIVQNAINGECHILFIVMLNAIKLSVIILSVAAPLKSRKQSTKRGCSGTSVVNYFTSVAYSCS